MWDEAEWFDYMKANNMKDPYAKIAAASLDAFF
jgi:hypothetical protein